MTMLPVATFSCGHTQDFATRSMTPSRGESCYCVRCRKYRTVTVAPTKYAVKCRSCRYSRATYGHVYVTAHRDITRHLRRKPEHTIELYDGLIKMSTYTSQQIPLDISTDDPPY